ncbi:hypothetical protein GTQ40_06385 [Flavobacteriaceae bacterium R38]|nr:hypothetical protein [Flavobacteriaceae bacterium R38]
MSKRDLKKYLNTLNKEQLEEQLIDLYERFNQVKTYYNFVFNPKEEKLIGECKAKISNEYFPTGKRKKPKMRRSVAQKFIKHFITIGVDPVLIADVMLFNLEIAQTFSSEKPIKQEAFYKSMFNSYKQSIEFIIQNGILNDFKPRLLKIYAETQHQDWLNQYDFEMAIEMMD